MDETGGVPFSGVFPLDLGSLVRVTHCAQNSQVLISLAPFGYFFSIDSHYKMAHLSKQILREANYILIRGYTLCYESRDYRHCTGTSKGSDRISNRTTPRPIDHERNTNPGNVE